MDLIREKNRARGAHLAQFGGGSSSSSASTTNNTDNRRTIAAGGISNEHGTVNVLDGGAIANAFNFADSSVGTSLASVNNTVAGAFDFSKGVASNAFDFSTSTQNNSFDFANRAQQTALSSLSSQTQLVANAYNDAKGRGAMTDWILLAAIAVAGLVAFHNKG